MERHQARTILLGLGEPTNEQRRADAIGVVIDLLLYPEQVVAGTDHEEKLNDAKRQRDELLCAAKALLVGESSNRRADLMVAVKRVEQELAGP